MRKTIGTNVSSSEYYQLKAIAELHSVSVSIYLRAIIADVLAEEGPKVEAQNCKLLKTA